MRVLDTVPAGAQAKILKAILAAQHPRLALGTIALNHNLTIDELQTIARHHGYPDRDIMARAVRDLLEPHPAQPATETPAAVVDAPTGLLNVHVKDLHGDPNNIRDNIGDITELADSIVAVGLLQPIVARREGNRLVVVAGHRRLAAVRQLGWDNVEVIVRPPMAPDDVLAAMIIENSQRVDLDPIEEARGLARLAADLDLTSHAAIGRKIGRTQVHVSGRLALLNLTPQEQEQVRAGQLGLGAAIAKARVDAGRIRPGAKGKKSSQHLSVHHELATRAQARCTQLNHKRNGSASVGGIACGACWESVIRADERASLHARSASIGSCVLCDTVLTSPAIGA